MKIYLIFVLLLMTTKEGYCADFVTAKAEYEKLYNMYSLNIANNDEVYTSNIPRLNTSQSLQVGVGFSLYSIGGYDAVAGSVEIMGALTLTWLDQTATFSNTDISSDDVPSMVVDYRAIWTPVIVLLNSADDVTRVGDETYKVRYSTSAGFVTWRPRVIVNAACSPDMTYFPFDQQKCSLHFAPWGQTETQIQLMKTTDEWGMTDYSENGVWTIEKTESKVEVKNGIYNAIFTITFNRAPTYFTVSLVLPVLLLSLLSGMVFLLPAVSGERVGFGITCFLSFVVLLQSLMLFLPETSSPMSLLCFYVIIMMMFSATLSVVTILLLRVYNKPEGDEIPRWLLHVLEVIRCVKCKRACRKSSKTIDFRNANTKFKIPDASVATTTNVFLMSASKPNGVGVNGNVSNHHNANDMDVTSVKSKNIWNDGGSEQKVGKEAPDIDWDTLGRTLDIFFFLAFLGAQGALSVFFLIPIGTRA